MALRNLIEGHLRNISTKLFENQPDTFREEDFLSFHYSHIRQNSPAPWWPCVLTNQYGLKESDKGSTKEHFYKIIWKSANQFWRRRFLKFFSFRCHGKQNSAWIPKIWRNSGEVIVRMLPVKFHPNWPTSYWGEKVDGRRTTDAGQKAITITHLEPCLFYYSTVIQRPILYLNLSITNLYYKFKTLWKV